MTERNIPVIRLHPDGEGAEFNPWQDVTHDGVIEGTPQDRNLIYFDQRRDMKGRSRVGIWESTAYAEKITDYPADEFMVVLEGSCTIVDADGHEEVFTVGDSFFMPKGFNGIWRQDSPMKKYFMMFLAD